MVFLKSTNIYLYLQLPDCWNQILKNDENIHNIYVNFISSQVLSFDECMYRVKI